MDNKEELELIKRYTPFIEGEHLALVPVSSESIQYFKSWYNDKRVRGYSRNPRPTLEITFTTWFEADLKNNQNHPFEIWLKDPLKPIGDCGLTFIQWPHRTAWLGLGLGDPKYWNRGFGTEVLKMLIDYGFSELNLNKLKAGIYSPNKASQKMAEKTGMIREAIFREVVFINGQYFDEYHYTIFKRDWEQKNEMKIAIKK